MRGVLLVALALTACNGPRSSPGFIETVHELQRENRLQPEEAAKVIAAYQDSREEPAWWEALTQEVVSGLVLLGMSILWIRFAPAKLGGRGAPEVVRRRRAGS